jgi:hypothetical protein
MIISKPDLSLESLIVKLTLIEVCIMFILKIFFWVCIVTRQTLQTSTL